MGMQLSIFEAVQAAKRNFVLNRTVESTPEEILALSYEFEKLKDAKTLLDGLSKG